MLSEQMQEALNDQLNAEMYSSYLYLAMAAEFGALGLKGFEHWMLCQSREEHYHAMKIYRYILRRHGRVMLASIDAPEAKWDSPMAAFAAAYEHERYITERVNTIVELAAAEKDYATKDFMMWYVREQVQEHESVAHVMTKLKLVGENPNGLMFVDKELGKRWGYGYDMRSDKAESYTEDAPKPHVAGTAKTQEADEGGLFARLRTKPPGVRAE